MFQAAWLRRGWPGIFSPVIVLYFLGVNRQVVSIETPTGFN